MYFVFRVLRKVSDGTYIIDGTSHSTLDAAKHHFHSVMNTYAYGQNAGYDYVECFIQNMSGSIVMGPEVDDRTSTPAEV